MSEETAAPLVVIRGAATEEEVAAVLAVVSGMAAAQQAAAAPERQPASEWGSPRRKVRVAHPHGPGGWRASALPR